MRRGNGRAHSKTPSETYAHRSENRIPARPPMAKPRQETRSQRTHQAIRTGSGAHAAGLCATPPRGGERPRMRWAWRGATTGSAATKPWVKAASPRCVHGRRSRGNVRAHGPQRGQRARIPRPTLPNKCCPSYQQPAKLAPRSGKASPAGRPRRPSRSAGDGGGASSTWGRDSSDASTLKRRRAPFGFAQGARSGVALAPFGFAQGARSGVALAERSRS